MYVCASGILYMYILREYVCWTSRQKKYERIQRQNANGALTAYTNRSVKKKLTPGGRNCFDIAAYILRSRMERDMGFYQRVLGWVLTTKTRDWLKKKKKHPRDDAADVFFSVPLLFTGFLTTIPSPPPLPEDRQKMRRNQAQPSNQSQVHTTERIIHHSAGKTRRNEINKKKTIQQQQKEQKEKKTSVCSEFKR